MLNTVLLIVGIVLLIVFFKWFWFSSTTNSYQFGDELDLDQPLISSNKNKQSETKETNKFKKIS